VSTRKRSSAAVLGVAVGSLVAGGVVFAPVASAAPSTTIVINEVYGAGGNAGAVYTHDFIELKNIGAVPVSVTGWSVQYASAAGTSWQTTGLTGTIAPGGRYLVTEAGTGSPTPTPNSTGTITMAAGAGKVALVNNATALTCNTSCVGATGVVDFAGYGTTASQWEGAGRTPAPTTTLSVSRNAAGADTDNNNLDFALATPTPESAGVSADPPKSNCPGDETIAIGTVQGNGSASPCVGETVTVTGTVVGDLQDGGFNGFFLQDSGDGKADTSDAVFVFSSYPVSLGDRVTVEATVDEYQGLTELTQAFVTKQGSGALPAATTLPLPSSDAQREALEGMLVAPSQALTVSEVFNLDRYGEIILSSGGRLVTPTEAAETGAPADAIAAENTRRSIVLDDGRTTRFDTAKPPLAPPYLTLDDPVRVGDTAQLQPVVLSYAFNLWRLEPADGTAEGTTFAATNPRPAAPSAVGGDLRIADFNVLNYFVDFPSEFGDDARGATTPEELAQQQAKIVTAITALDADVITLHEIENSAVLTPETPYRAVETLVAALNRAQGKDTWRFVQAHEASDVITNAIIYRVNAAQPVGEPMKPAEDAVWDNAREPIAQTFRSRGEVFSVIANHLKSKGSGCGTGSDRPDTQGGNCNGDRVAQATALVAFAQQVATAAGDPDVLMTGDFNAYRNEDPLDVVRAAGFIEVFTPGEYSYVFGGGSGSLDHVFASPSMLPKVTGHTIWDINAVESFAYEYDAPFEGLYAPYPYRASDHNPTLVGVDTKFGTPAAGKGRG
jgi:predicted extracellular nuclease